MTDLLTRDIDIYTVCANDRPVVGGNILQPPKPCKLLRCPSFIKRIWCFGKNVGKWLKSQSAYTLHKPARKRYLTRPYRVSGIDQLWQADLADMQPLAPQNDGYRFILTVIDVFSRKGWAKAVKSKKIQDIKPAFQQIFREHGDTPTQIQSDEGMEFESHAMKEFFGENDIEQYSVKSQFKASLVERFNRTLKTKMYRYFTHKRTRKWIDVLPSLIESYNNSHHRGIRMAPNQVNASNEMLIWLYNEEGEEPVPKKKNMCKLVIMFV